MSDCERCNGNGEIEAKIETLQCPNCRDVCQWCNQPCEDGEPLGDTGLAVCRTCIQDMAVYKEDVEWSLHVTVGLDALLDDPDEFRADLSSAVSAVFDEYGFGTDSGEWEVRNAEAETAAEEVPREDE